MGRLGLKVKLVMSFITCFLSASVMLERNLTTGSILLDFSWQRCSWAFSNVHPQWMITCPLVFLFSAVQNMKKIDWQVFNSVRIRKNIYMLVVACSAVVLIITSSPNRILVSCMSTLPISNEYKKNLHLYSTVPVPHRTTSSSSGI